MNRVEWIRMAGMLAAASLAVFVPGGCNNNDSPNTSGLDDYFATHSFVIDPRSTGSSPVSLTPSAAQIDDIGGKAVFTASGGSGGYSWDVANSSVGSISGSGNQGVYTATAIGNNNVIVYDSQGNAAVANIGGTAAEALSITASPATLTTDFTLSVLKVSGGQAGYTWTVSSSGRGNFSGSASGASVVYERYSSGDNAVTVTDSLGNRASLVISQP